MSWEEFTEIFRVMGFLLTSTATTGWSSPTISACRSASQARGHHIRGGADKSLARPGRKQATANKLGIYSTHSPRSSVHLLALCSNFCKSLKKKFRKLAVQPGLYGSNDLRVGRKMATFQLFFQAREQVVDRRGQIRRIGWVIKTVEA